jgi:hypothetical protein
MRESLVTHLNALLLQPNFYEKFKRVIKEMHQTYEYIPNEFCFVIWKVSETMVERVEEFKADFEYIF